MHEAYNDVMCWCTHDEHMDNVLLYACTQIHTHIHSYIGTANLLYNVCFSDIQGWFRLAPNGADSL